MKKLKFLTIGIIISISLTLKAQSVITYRSIAVTDPAEAFRNPPESAKPGVLWMWMGSNLSKVGITRDLEALKKAGFNRTTMFSLADITTSLAGEIGKSPTPEIISWTEPWWKLVRYAAEESKRLGMDFGMFNCPGYETSGGSWITPELSMQEICWSNQTVAGNSHISLRLERPKVDPRANHPFPVYNRETGLEEIPEIPARKTYYKDIAVLAVPSTGFIAQNSVINLTGKMQSDGQIDWDAPMGEWTIYRFGHTTTGALIFPAQWKATGFECDKMSQEAVDFHIDHVISEIQKHLGDLIGTGFSHVHFDSYEAGNPTWTPKMQVEFLKRRGYDLTPYLVTFAGRKIGSREDSLKFRNDFEATIKDLYRDVYFTTISKKLRAANLTFLCEPYGGPWRQDDVMPLVHNVMTEFWTDKGAYTPYQLEPTVAALRKSGQNIIEAEAFTGQPLYSRWSETPSWFKPIGDGAFCAGVNRIIIHRFVQQSWDDRYKPGATMGQWGSHFDRIQTWWNQSEAMVKYWQRCQALLQWGSISTKSEDDFSAVNTEGGLQIKSIHRKMGSTNIYFVANLSHNIGSATCSFNISGMQPELWDPVTGTTRNLTKFEWINDKTSIPLKFDDAQSYFVVFRNKAFKPDPDGKSNFPSMKEVLTIKGPWQVTFDPVWGGPAKPVTFTSLDDWTNYSEPGIKYYSGTATYKTSFDVPSKQIADKQSVFYLDLGVVKHVARVVFNNKDLGVVWTAPWNVKLPAMLLKEKGNQIEVQITNVWANRLIGDEQEPADCEWLPGYTYFKAGSFLKEFPDWFLKKEQRPSKGRYCFTTWNYFTKDSPLISSGLIGPVTIESIYDNVK
ncbi:MAG: glycosyl hydrolase [Bacteroidota bacterium]|nr:glycosyl hydrolase [Bacteroidota bacterium]